MAAVESHAAQIVEANKTTPATKSARQQGTKDLQKTRLCAYYLQGKCGLGSDCAFAHSSSEVRATPDLKKTQLCAKFAEGACADADCAFAHGEAELRQPPSFRKKLCKWNAKGMCRNGAKCGFAHDTKELRMETPPGDETQVAEAPFGAPPGLAHPSAECHLGMVGEQPVPEEPLFRLAAGRGAAPLQQQVSMMSSAIGALSTKLAHLEGMMVQTQVHQLQQEIQQLNGQCWALETGLCMAQQPVLAARPTPLKSRLNTKAAPFVPLAFGGDAASDDSTSVGSGSE